MAIAPAIGQPPIIVSTAIFPCCTARRALCSRWASMSSPKRRSSRRIDQLARVLARELVAFITLTCLVGVASAAPVCEMTCALHRFHAPFAAPGHSHDQHGWDHRAKAATADEAAEQLHAGACHLFAAPVPSSLRPRVGPLAAPRLSAREHTASMSSLSWPPLERPPKQGTSF